MVIRYYQIYEQVKTQLDPVKTQSYHPQINFEIQNYYLNEPKFYGVYSRNNFYKIKDGTYVINLDEFKSVGTRWISLYDAIVIAL